MKAILPFPLMGKVAKAEIKCYNRKQKQFWPPCYTWCFQYWFPLTAAFFTSFAPGFHNPKRKKMNFTSQMLELLVQNVTKYQQLCQGTWGHRKKPFKWLGDEQDPISLLLLVSCDLRSAGKVTTTLFAKQKKGVHGRNSRGKERIKTDVPKATKGDSRLAVTTHDYASQPNVHMHPKGVHLRCRFSFSRWGPGLCISNKLPCGVGAV